MCEVLARGDLGTAVAMFRVAAQLSQQELAELTGWSQATVSLVETNRRGTLYDIRELLKFADSVCMPREALLPLMLSRPVVLVSAELAAVCCSARRSANSLRPSASNRICEWIRTRRSVALKKSSPMC